MRHYFTNFCNRATKQDKLLRYSGRRTNFRHLLEPGQTYAIFSQTFAIEPQTRTNFCDIVEPGQTYAIFSQTFAIEPQSMTNFCHLVEPTYAI